MLANDYLNTADGKYYKINDKGEITGGKPEGRALMKTYLDTYNTILNNSDVRDYYAMDKEIGNISKNFNSKAIHDETQRIIMSRAINLDNTEWFDGKGDIKHIAIVPVKIMSLDNKIDGKSVNGQKVSGLYEEFLRTVVEDDGMKFPQMANLKDSQIVSTVQSDMNRNNSYYAGLFKDFIKDKDIYIKEEVEDTKVDEGADIKVDEGKKNNIVKSKEKIEIKTSIVPTGIKDNVSGKVLTWEKIEETNQVDKLSPEHKAAYDEWKAKQKNKKSFDYLSESQKETLEKIKSKSNDGLNIDAP